ncbi:MAG: type II toxin-antitoxin system PemK/MazF family toxin [Candidatus Acidiferrales bacterium]
MKNVPPGDSFPKRGFVYWARLDKRRPVVVLSVNAINRHALDVCVVPLTSVARRHFRLRVPVQPPEGGLRNSSWAKCDQVTTIEKARLLHPAAGVLSAATMRGIEAAVATCLGLDRGEQTTGKSPAA